MYSSNYNITNNIKRLCLFSKQPYFINFRVTFSKINCTVLNNAHVTPHLSVLPKNHFITSIATLC